MSGNLKVLVVDDDRRMVRTICDILKAEGFVAEAAYSGEEAVYKADMDDVGCVLMDLKMGGINGLETLKLLKGKKPNLPVVLMSAFASEEQMREARMRGAYSILTKPIDIQLVISFLSMLRREKNILIVDDDPVFSRTLKDILEVRGCRVETEVSAEKVLGHMEAEYKLLVILDLKLGNKNGSDLLKDIHARYPTKPVVLVTGCREEMAGSIEKGRQIGAYACLYKPFEADKLINIVEEVRHMKLKAVLEEPFRRQGSFYG
jgi:DNA-binding NtrC family response regulator